MDYTKELYNNVKHNTALWRWLNEDKGSVLSENGYWFIETVSVSGYADMSDKAHAQLEDIMEKEYNLKWLYRR